MEIVAECVQKIKNHHQNFVYKLHHYKLSVVNNRLSICQQIFLWKILIIGFKKVCDMFITVKFLKV